MLGKSLLRRAGLSARALLPSAPAFARAPVSVPRRQHTADCGPGCSHDHDHDHHAAPAAPVTLDQWLTTPQEGMAMQDKVDARSIVRLACTLNRDAQDPWFHNNIHGAHPASHWMFCTEGGMTNELNADGYWESFRPPAPYTVCMWGGGTIHFHDALRINDDVQALTRLSRPILKTGKTGSMVVASRTTDYVSKGNKHLIRDVTNLIYRDASAPRPEEPVLTPEQEEARARPLVKGTDYDWERSVPFETDPRALLRFSALTWNAHRIHYDTAFAQSDGHDGVLVHGPLQATVLLDFAGEVSAALAPAQEPIEERYYNRLLFKRLRDEQRSAATAAQQHAIRQGLPPPPAQAVPDVAVPSVDKLPAGYDDVVGMNLTAWHLRYHKLRSMSYRALRPLTVGTKVRVMGKLISDEGRADAEELVRENAEWVANPTRRTPPSLDDEHYWKRVLPAKAKVWIQDAEKADVRYMEAELTFTKLNKAYIGSKAV